MSFTDTDFVKDIANRLGESPDRWIGVVIATDAITTLMVVADQCNVSAESAHLLLATCLGSLLDTPMGEAAVSAYHREC